jgi:nucleoside-diphosphate-sugar epimerase
MAKKKQKKVLVAGATGYIGGRVIEGLHDQGFWTRALVRGDRSRLERPECADDVFSGEAVDANTIQGLCEGIDVVFSSLGYHSFARKPSIWDIDFGANMNILKEAKKAGVKHFVFISTVRGQEMIKYSAIADARERVALAITQTPNMNYTIIRPTGFYNDMTYNFNMAAKSGKIWLVGDPYVRMNPLNGLDLADEIIDSITNPKKLNTERDVGGPEVYTRKEICEMIFEVLGKPYCVKSVPSGVLTFMTKVMKPWHPNGAALVGFINFLTRCPDMTGDLCGSRYLRDYFEELAKERGLID